MMLNNWVEDLAEFTPEIVAAACNEWRKGPEHKQRPLPGDIRAECIARANRAGARLEQRKELTEDEIAELADKWARHHGHDSIADMQRSKEFRGGYLPIAPGRFRKFAPIRQPQPPIAVEPIPTPVVQLKKTKSATPAWIVERDSKREDQKNEEAGKLEHVRSLVDMLIDRQQAPEEDKAA